MFVNNKGSDVGQLAWSVRLDPRTVTHQWRACRISEIKKVIYICDAKLVCVLNSAVNDILKSF